MKTGEEEAEAEAEAEEAEAAEEAEQAEEAEEDDLMMRGESPVAERSSL